MKYKQITVSTTHEFSELVALILTEAGSEGVTIMDKYELKATADNTYWDYVDEKFFSSMSETVLVSGFFDLHFDQNIISSELELMKERASLSSIECGSLEIVGQVIDSAVWENVWKKYYKPMKIGSVSIVPKWLKNTHKNTTAVFINPGMAFGTGSHETTQMCIELMQKTNLKDKIIADVGCGSGILGITALKLNAKNCTFVDTDINAVKATEENCTYNNVLSKAKIINGSLLENNDIKFDVILANLTADLLLMLFEGLSSNIKSGGIIIISGIISKRLEEVKNRYLTQFKLTSIIEKNDWCGVMFEKN